MNNTWIVSKLLEKSAEATDVRNPCIVLIELTWSALVYYIYLTEPE